VTQGFVLQHNMLTLQITQKHATSDCYITTQFVLDIVFKYTHRLNDKLIQNEIL